MTSHSLEEALLEQKQRFEPLYLWLEENMPPPFFKEISKEWISLIVNSLTEFKEQDYFIQLHLKQAAISLSLNESETDLQILAHYPLKGIKSYMSYPSLSPFPSSRLPLKIVILRFIDILEEKSEPLSLETQTQLSSLLEEAHPEWHEKKRKDLLEAMDGRFLRSFTLQQQCALIELYAQAEEQDGCLVLPKKVEPFFLMLAWKNAPKHQFLYHIARVVYHHGAVMQRVNATYLAGSQDRQTTIFLLTFELQFIPRRHEAFDLADFLQELSLVKYFGALDRIEEQLVAHRLIRGNLGHWLRSCIHFIHQLLAVSDPYLFSLENIEEAFLFHPELTEKLCQIFEYKFHPLKRDLALFSEKREAFVQAVSELDTGEEALDRLRKQILFQALQLITYTLKVNFYVPHKTALGFRLDPSYLADLPFQATSFFPEKPFAIFFVMNLHFVGFHVRFKDLARGGVRTIYLKRGKRAGNGFFKGKEPLDSSRASFFIECYQLALTQHKKNKDLPEGGSKAVLFLDPEDPQLTYEREMRAHAYKTAGYSEEAIEEQLFVFQESQQKEHLYQTQRVFITTLLSLINTTPEGKLREAAIVDYWGKPEFLYLGPDENMHNEMINWIAEESRRSHYALGGAFISGKSGPDGINHKEYGVTSLGVTIYMQRALDHLRIDPKKQSFTVKMTGGPDGDVAGNQILNLYRYYPHTAKLVALTDVSGTIYDPQGIDLASCVQLFREVKPIRFYPPQKLGRGGFLLDREQKRESAPHVQQTLCLRQTETGLFSDWLSGNEMNSLYRHQVHKTPADLFIPCGGRPQTLQEKNYMDFLDSVTGIPTARVIIEGANLYLSEKARHLLEQKGVLIIKDSSANKGGVISSSFEVLAALVLREEFGHHKDRLVPEILERIRAYAADEAELLFREHEKKAEPLTELSDALSSRIHYFKDQLLTHFESFILSTSPEEPLNQLFLRFCLPFLRENYAGACLNAIAENHRKAAIAAYLATSLVYQRGLSWWPSVVDILPLLL